MANELTNYIHLYINPKVSTLFVDLSLSLSLSLSHISAPVLT